MGSLKAKHENSYLNLHFDIEIPYMPTRLNQDITSFQL